MGLQGMINDMVARCDVDLGQRAPQDAQGAGSEDGAERLRNLAQIITALENGAWPETLRKKALIEKRRRRSPAPTLGITGTGGAGKSSLTDELIRRFRLDQDDSLKIAIISIDPSRKRTGGALLGDRIRMNAIEHPNIYMRSLATRDTGAEISKALPDVIAACKVAGFDLIVVETSGIGQGDAAIVPLVDVSLYVMTPEFGAAIAAGKDRHARLRRFRRDQQVRPQGRRGCAARRAQAVPAQPRTLRRDSPTTCRCSAPWRRASTTTASPRCIRRWCRAWPERGLKLGKGRLPLVSVKQSSAGRAIVPAERVRYLAEIADTLRGYHRQTAEQAALARERQSLHTAKAIFEACEQERRRLRRTDRLEGRPARRRTPGSCWRCGRT